MKNNDVSSNQSKNLPQYGQKQVTMINKIKGICGDLTGKIILDMGCDIKGLLVKAIIANFQSVYVYGVNPGIHEDEQTDKYHLLKQDGTKESKIADSSIDICISLAAFEHFHDLPGALREINRVLKPGGLLYTEFGPIYSGCWGHHLWIRHNGKDYTYINNPLPPFCHLLMTEESLRQYCINSLGHSSDLANKIADYVFNSEEQNKMYFEDYERITRDCPLDVLMFSGLQSIPYKQEYKPENYALLFDSLRKKYPNNYGFCYNAISMLLIKPF